MIRAYRAFGLKDGMLAPCVIEDAEPFAGPIVRGDPPYSEERYRDVLADPLTAIRENGEDAVLYELRPNQEHGFHAWAEIDDAVSYAQTGSERPEQAYRLAKHLPSNEWAALRLFWSYYDPSQSWARHPVVGEVELFGRVVEHEIGYRAQSFRICKLWVQDPTIDREALEKRYHCEVELWPTSDEKSGPTKSSPENSTRPGRSRLSLRERMRQYVSGRASPFPREFTIALYGLAVLNAGVVTGVAAEGSWQWLFNLALVGILLAQAIHHHPPDSES